MIIGLIGHSGCGKDTVADYLVSKYGFIKIALADPLKRMCKDALNFSYDQLWGSSEKRNLPDSRYKGLTPRKALQLLGTEWGRACYEDVWIDYAIREATRVMSENKYSYNPEIGAFAVAYGTPVPKGVVIPDVRFSNEIMKVGEIGKTFKIRRPGYSGQQAMEAGVSNHSSETEMDTASYSLDAIIDNSGSVEHLYKQIDNIMESIYVAKHS